MPKSIVLQPKRDGDKNSASSVFDLLLGYKVDSEVDRQLILGVLRDMQQGDSDEDSEGEQPEASSDNALAEESSSRELNHQVRDRGPTV